MPGDPDVVINKSHVGGGSFRYKQAMHGNSLIHQLYTATIVLALDYNNNIDIIKHRHREKDQNMSVDDTVEIMMDMLCRMIFRGRMDMFQDALKQNLCEAVKETIRGGEPDEDTI